MQLLKISTAQMNDTKETGINFKSLEVHKNEDIDTKESADILSLNIFNNDVQCGMKINDQLCLNTFATYDCYEDVYNVFFVNWKKQDIFQIQQQLIIQCDDFTIKNCLTKNQTIVHMIYLQEKYCTSYISFNLEDILSTISNNGLLHFVLQKTDIIYIYIYYQ